MKILAFDFSSSQRSVAVACGLGHVREVIETSRGHTMQPFAMIEAVLTQANIERAEIERIVVGLGPGSYTGIRAGIAMAQGWQLACGVKLIGISSVEAVAAQAREDGLRGAVSVIVDAQRGEFYLATWDLSDAGQRKSEPLRIVSAEEAQAQVGMGRCIIGPEVTRWFPAGRIMFPRAAMLAKLALDGSEFVADAALEPVYLRETTFIRAPVPRVV